MSRFPWHKIPGAVTFFGLTASVAGAIVGWAMGAMTGAQSFILGLLGTVLTMQFETMVRSEQEYELKELVHGPQWLARPLRLISEHCARIVEDFDGTPVEQEAQRLLQRCCTEFDTLRLGRIRRTPGDVKHLIEYTARAQRELVGVTNVGVGTGDPRWWQESESGKEYWVANQEAVGRIAIRRVFIYGAGDEEKASALARFQRDVGIDVRLVHRDRLTPELRLNFALWDRRLAWEAQMNADGTPVANVTSLGAGDVQRLSDAFDEIWQAAARLQDPPTPTSTPTPGTVADGERATSVAPVAQISVQRRNGEDAEGAAS